MIVVSDTSAITSLVQIGREQILKFLFDRVLIPPAVRDELMAFHKILPEFIEVSSAQNKLRFNHYSKSWTAAKPNRSRSPRRSRPIFF